MFVGIAVVGIVAVGIVGVGTPAVGTVAASHSEVVKMMHCKDDVDSRCQNGVHVIVWLCTV